MDLQTTIIGLVTLLLFALLIVYIQRKQKQEKVRRLKEFLLIARQNELTITQHEVWDPSYTIGIDKAKRKLLYTQTEEGKTYITLIDLEEIEQCKVNKIISEVNTDKNIERLEIVFTPYRSNHPKKAIEMYSKEKKLNFGNELKLSEKWRDIVNATHAVLS